MKQTFREVTHLRADLHGTTFVACDKLTTGLRHDLRLSQRHRAFSNECRKTKTKVITLANQKGRRQSGKPIKAESNYTKPTQSAGKYARVSHDW